MIGRILFSTTMLVSVLAGSAAAQDASAPGTLAEVMVTAQKREQKLQEVPISMEVVSGAKLDDFNTGDFKGMFKFIPNVSVETTAGNDVIYIRGFGSPPANFSFDQAVSLYVDGVYAGRNRQAQSPFFDLARVEVLRGPQGALFGKNTPAGAISVVSAGPTSAFEGAVKGSYNFDLEGPEVSGYVSGPITDQVGARLALKLVDQEGYVKNLFNGQDGPKNRSALARLTLRYAPTEDFDYSLKVEFADKQVRGGLNVSSPLTAKVPKETRFSTQNPIGKEGTDVTSWLVSGTGNLALGDFTLTSITGYSFFQSNIVNNFDQTVPATGAIVRNSVYNSFPEHFRQWSQEVRLLSPTGGKFEYVVGAYYDQSLYRLSQLGGFDVNIPGVLVYLGLLNTEFRQRAESISVFGQGTFHVSDQLRLLGSLRYTQTDKRAHFFGNLLQGPFALRPVNTRANGSLSEDNVDPSATLQYDIAPEIMVYATYGRGSKSGGFVSNTYGTTNATFRYQPEKSENFEAGVKSTLADGRLVLNVSVYDTSFKDLQVSVYNSTLQVFQTGNAASASSRGIEGSAAWYPVDNLDITLAAAYQDAKYDDYPGAGCLATQTLAECNPAVPASQAANNIAGAPLSYTSKYSFSAQGHYRFDLGNETAIDATVGLHGRSKYFDSDNQNPFFGRQKGYAKLDARLQYGASDERWHVAIVGKNLTDEKTTGSSFNLPFPITAVPRAILYLEETRNVAVEAGFKF